MQISRLLLLGSLSLAFGCKDSTGPTGPAALEPVGAGEITAAVGASEQVVVRVADAQGRPLGGIPVAWAVTAGDGSVAPPTTLTGATGEAATTWTLGTSAGLNTLSAVVDGLPPRIFTATAQPGPAASLSATGDAPDTALAGAIVSPSPTVVVRDAFGNPVPGIAVTFAVTSGGGAVDPASVTTNAAGEAGTSWTLGAGTGLNRMVATVAGLSAAALTVTTIPGPPASMESAVQLPQTALIATAVSPAPAVAVRDEFGNPVAGVAVSFAVTEGGGEVTGDAQITNAQGVATVGAWTLGSAAQPNALTATAAGLPDAIFTIQAHAINIFIDAVHLTQGSQTLAGSIGAVAGRPGLLRVVVRATASNAVEPPVRVRLYQSGSLLREATIAAPRPDVPVSPDLSDLSHTWNLPLSAEEVVTGLAVEAVVDPDETIPGDPLADNRFPRDEGSASLDVQGLYPLRIVFFPVHATVHGTTGSITSANLDVFLEATRQWIPSNVILPTVRDPYTTELDLSVGSSWSTLLSELQALRTAEGAVDEYYHGIIGEFPTIAYGGLAYRPTHPSSGFRSGLSYDRHPFATGTIAHELGHNMGRLHSPCGNPPSVDQNYPHSNALLGSAGFDILSGLLRHPQEFHDYMGYCIPRWTSDYTYDAILQWRRQDSLGQPDMAPARAASAPATSGLLVWGRIHSGGVTLNPAFALDAPPRLPSAAGPNQVRGTASDGREIFRVSFDGVAVEDGPDPNERHFAYFVPLRAADLVSLARIEVLAATGSATRVAQAPGPAATAEIRLQQVAGDRVRVRWDAGRYPMAIVRDARTGRVLSFARSGDAVVQAGRRSPDHVEVILSDGVTSHTPIRK